MTVFEYLQAHPNTTSGEIAILTLQWMRDRLFMRYELWLLTCLINKE
ncbi:Uncharacterised protein [Citrobacter freundii]|nr:Uncharacterised protein [Citrobacter freundii]